MENGLDPYSQGSRMASLCLRLVFYTVAVISAQRVSVFQPPSLKVLEGRTVTLECTYFSSENTSISHYTWSYQRNPSSPRTVVSNKADRYSGRLYQISQSTSFADRKADITIQDVRYYDAGMYFCEVELFDIGIGRGSGTLLEVVQALKVSVFQPQSVKVMEGDTVTLECSYINMEENRSGRYFWFYSRFPSGSRTIVSNNTDHYSGRLFQTNESTFFSERKADITIQDIQLVDAGMYFCEVDLFLGFGHGNGTWLEVIQGAPTTPKEEGTTETVEVQLPISFLLQMGRTVVVLLVFGIIVLVIARCYAKKEPKKHSVTQVMTNDYLE